MPCGPPKPRKAVLETVCVFIRREWISASLQRVGVVGVEHRAVGDGAGQIGRIAAARRLVEADAADAAVAVEADVVVDAEIVALAGHLHVVVAVEPELCGPAGLRRGERRDGRDQRRLALLAAEAAAHAAHLHRDGVVGQAEHLGDGVLDLGRVLGGGMDQHVAVLAGDGVGDLAFEVEMVLPADMQRAGDAVRGGGERGVRVAEPHLVRRQRGRHRRRARPPP